MSPQPEEVRAYFREAKKRQRKRDREAGICTQRRPGCTGMADEGFKSCAVCRRIEAERRIPGTGSEKEKATKLRCETCGKSFHANLIFEDEQLLCTDCAGEDHDLEGEKDFD